jgi:ATP-binding cassette subfamily B protein
VDAEAAPDSPGPTSGREGRPRKPTLRLLRGYLRRYRGVLAAGFGFLVGSQLLLVFAPQVLRRALDVVDPETARAPDPAASATRLALLYVGVVAGQGLLNFLTRRRLVGFSRLLERDLKRDVFGHLARLPYAFFDRMRTGDLLSRLTSDVEAVRFSVGPGIMYLSQTAVKVPAALAVMLWMDWRLTLLLAVTLSGVAAVVRLLAPSILRLSRAVQERVADLSARAQESFAGARVVRAYATEDLESAAFRGRADALLGENLALARRRAALSGGLRLMGDLAVLCVLWFGGRQVIGQRVAHGTLVAFLAYGDMLLWPMISLGYVLASFQRAAGAMQRLDEILVEPAEGEGEAPVDPAAAPRARGEIDVAGLTFAYPGSSRTALTDVSVRVPAGTTLGLVGPIGGGKTTLVSLLARLYPVPDGTVFLDGVDVNRVPLERLRAAFAFVPQDAFLFSESLRENLSYGLREAPPAERLDAAAWSAGLDADLSSLPKGLETVVGERGLTLSGGQKQRATLARALAAEGSVLVLDDSLSAVDTRTEATILDRWKTARRGRTAIVVAHRLSTVRDADQIVVLDGGRVVERGTHESLLAAGGWYARTYGLQRLHAEIESLS